MYENLHGVVSNGCREAVQGGASQAPQRAVTYFVLAVVGSSVIYLCGLVGLLWLFAHDGRGGARGGASRGCLSTAVGISEHPSREGGP